MYRYVNIIQEINALSKLLLPVILKEMVVLLEYLVEPGLPSLLAEKVLPASLSLIAIYLSI